MTKFGYTNTVKQPSVIFRNRFQVRATISEDCALVESISSTARFFNRFAVLAVGLPLWLVTDFGVALALWAAYNEGRAIAVANGDHSGSADMLAE